MKQPPSAAAWWSSRMVPCGSPPQVLSYTNGTYAGSPTCQRTTSTRSPAPTSPRQLWEIDRLYDQATDTSTPLSRFQTSLRRLWTLCHGADFLAGDLSCRAGCKSEEDIAAVAQGVATARYCLRQCLDWLSLVVLGMDIVERVVPDGLWEIFQDVASEPPLRAPGRRSAAVR